MPTTIVQTIEEVLEAPVGPDLISHVEHLSDSHLGRLQQACERFHSEYRLPYKAASQFRPYLHPGLLGMTRDRDVLDYTAFWNFDAVTTPAVQEDALKCYLLYCHGVILQDPLLYILDFVGSDEYKKVTRERLTNYLSFLSYIKPLVDCGIVLFIDEAQYKARDRVTYP